MSKTKVRSHLLQLVDSDFEDGIGGNEFDVARPSTKSQSAMPPKKAKAGRQPANRVTKPAPKTSTSRRGASDRVAAAVEEATAGQGTNKGSNATTAPPAKGPGRGRGRKPAATADAEDEDTIMTEATETVTETPPAAKAKGTRGRPKKVVVEAEPEPPAARRGRKPAAKKATTEDVSEIPETQQPDTTQSDIEEDQDDLAILPTLKSPERARTGRGSVPIPSSISKRPLPASSSDKGDPALRRRLGEMTQKYEALEQKHRDLKEVAVREAERNFDKLKKASEEKSKASDQLIASLKAELAAQKEASKQTALLQKNLSAASAQTTILQSQLSDLTTALSDSKSEIKSLHLKLSAARSAEAAAAAAVKLPPGSAIKHSSTAAGAAALRQAAASASSAQQTAQKKEDLYSDLTGLIVRGVKRGDDEDVFDCIQTGRNGTLHFKLAVDVNGEEGGGGGETHCHYTPQLDAGRDRALIAVLPGYLVDEISFPQAQAGKFYARVLKALNEAAEG